jgi:hypothetical protein
VNNEELQAAIADMIEFLLQVDQRLAAVTESVVQLQRAAGRGAAVSFPDPGAVELKRSQDAKVQALREIAQKLRNAPKR